MIEESLIVGTYIPFRCPFQITLASVVAYWGSGSHKRFPITTRTDCAY